MKGFKRARTKEAREFWAYVDKTTREVLRWPEWKRAVAEDILQIPKKMRSK